MHNRLMRRAGALSGALALTLVVFVSGVAAGRSSAEGARPAPTTTAPVALPVATPAPPHVIVYGDSLVTQAEPYLDGVAPALGLDVEVRALGGTAPCDFVDRIDEDLAAKRVDLAIWAFSGNSIAGCMAGPDGIPLSGQALLDKYRDDTERASAAAAALGVPFVLASPPASHLPGDVWEQLDSVYRWLAAAHPTIQYVDAGIAISPEGKFVDTQRCLPFEQRIPQAREACAADGTITVRGSDGHFCPVSSASNLGCTAYSSGAMRYAINLLQAARLELDYRAQVAAGNTPRPQGG